ncbi:MAG: DNA cytosine methyltransferase [Pseudanabaena sp. CAN_BIN31]|nr:DNA cytosine methyltransferase [Pseudanabaena sp. CAN_BIN31]
MIEKKLVVDLFCGCGGLSFGFLNAGYDIVLGIDHDINSLETFKKNHKSSQVICGDIMQIDTSEIEKHTNNMNVDVLIGGPPCQGVSLSGHRLKEDPRNELFSSYLKIVSQLKPSAFVMENVPGLIGLFNGELKDFLLKEFQKIGYAVSYKIMNAAEYGVPQSRKRVFFVGLLNGKKFEFPQPLISETITSFDALSDLPEKNLEDGSPYFYPASKKYQELMRKESNGIYNHQITNHSEKTTSIISLVPDGGNYKNLPLDLRQTRKVNIAWTRLNSQKPSFTIDTGHRHHFHYVYDRIPTVRESARIQSFPDSFIFVGNKTSQYRQVGNAVPPLLAEVIAKKLLEYI